MDRIGRKPLIAVTVFFLTLGLLVAATSYLSGVDAADKKTGGDIVFLMPKKVPAGQEYIADRHVVFGHSVHDKAKIKCTACHKRSVGFSLMKLGKNKVSMDAIYEGKQCGSCHNGEDAFAVEKDNQESCAKCHNARLRPAPEM